jgi:hypothetical protein
VSAANRQDTSRAASGRQQAPDAAAPKPYNQVITSAATMDSGVFIVHRIGEKLFYEIPAAMFGREFLLVADQRGTIRGIRYAGEEISNRIVVWERMGNKVFLRIVSYAMRADSAQPVARAVRLSNIAPIVMSFDVAAWRRLMPPDTLTLVQMRQPSYGARFEMQIGSTPTTGFVADRGFLGLQLESGARVTLRRSEGKPMVYYRTRF